MLFRKGSIDRAACSALSSTRSAAYWCERPSNSGRPAPGPRTGVSISGLRNVRQVGTGLPIVLAGEVLLPFGSRQVAAGGLTCDRLELLPPQSVQRRRLQREVDQPTSVRSDRLRRLRRDGGQC